MIQYATKFGKAAPTKKNVTILGLNLLPFRLSKIQTRDVSARKCRRKPTYNQFSEETEAY